MGNQPANGQRAPKRIVMPAAKVDPVQKQVMAAQMEQAKQNWIPASRSTVHWHRANLSAQLKKGAPASALAIWFANHTEPGRVTRAIDMLKQSSFQLFSDISETSVGGVVRSQYNEEVVYSCCLRSDGRFCCVSQDLELCMGMQGYPCKHLLVLLLGLVSAKELESNLVKNWVGRTLEHDVGQRVIFDAAHQAQIFIRYKGAEAGTVDWRATETIPEDFYAF
jgi:hypothetical protein